MAQNDSLINLGSAIPDIFAFLMPVSQHKLRRTSSAMCEWFDSAAENGSLAFFITFASLALTPAVLLRWRHATSSPRGNEPNEQVNLTIPQATVTLHFRNYCLSTFNKQAPGEADDAIIDHATIELAADFPFEHKLVVTGLFGIRSIGDGFCRGVKAVEIEFKGEGSQLRSVGHRWMFGCQNTKSVTFAGFTALEEVGKDWMYCCSSLETITFADDMPNLKKVGGNWMSGCKTMKNVDLAGFASLEEVGYWWMGDCSSLESIAFAGDLPNLKKIGFRWMSNCSKLKHFHLTGCIALEEVGGGWMYGCTDLESITFAADMIRLKKIGGGWLHNCPHLKHLDLTHFTALEEVGSCLMSSSCPQLEGIPNLTQVGCKWKKP